MVHLKKNESSVASLLLQEKEGKEAHEFFDQLKGDHQGDVEHLETLEIKLQQDNESLRVQLKKVQVNLTIKKYQL